MIAQTPKNPLNPSELAEELFFLLAAAWAAVRGDPLCGEDKARIILAIKIMTQYQQALWEPTCLK